MAALIKSDQIISIHAPTRGATQPVAAPPHRAENFNPRTHTGCDFKCCSMRMMQIISIHAPTRGATIYPPAILAGIIISIHAPTRGAT